VSTLAGNSGSGHLVLRAGPGRLKMKVAMPLPEYMEEMQISNDTCIFKHLELKRLAVDPITLAQLEAEVIGETT
jgi:hypothetical protein